MSAFKALAIDRVQISYRPKLREVTGSITAAILLQQMMYWWDKSSSKPFYKFKEPCSHHTYREGDSWCEELGFSRHEFDAALKHLTSRGLVSKKTSIDRLTHYSVDEVAIGKVINRLYVKPNSGATESKIPALVHSTKTTTKINQNNTNKAGLQEVESPKPAPTENPIVCDVNNSFVEDQKIEKPEAVDDDTYRHLLPSLKTLKTTQAAQILQLLVLSISEGSIKTSQVQMGGGLIKAARAGTLDTSRLIAAKNTAKASLDNEKREEARAAREKAQERAHLERLARMGGVDVRSLGGC